MTNSTYNQINNTDSFRKDLYSAEQPMYDAFVKSEGRNPKSMMELMQYSVGLQDLNRKERQFWGGVFGL